MQSPDPSTEAAAALEAWIVASLPWLGAALLLAVCAGVVGVFLILRRTQELQRLGERLDALEDLRGSVAKLSAARADLDLRRVEHVLLEIRDGQRRVEDRLLRTVESARAAPLAGAGEAAGLGDRVIDRLLALGYERVLLVTPQDELLGLASDEGGEVQVEAHRNGVLCKGRVVVRGGALVDVEMKSSYTTFP
jgi:hypothetical protein